MKLHAVEVVGANVLRSTISARDRDGFAQAPKEKVISTSLCRSPQASGRPRRVAEPRSLLCEPSCVSQADVSVRGSATNSS